MTKEELSRMVWKLVDNNSNNMAKDSYYEFLMQLSADAETRAEAVELELDLETPEDDDDE